MRFSEKNGYKKVRDVFQIESMDKPLRVALWNILTIYVWNRVQSSSGIYPGAHLSDSRNTTVRLLCRSLWADFFEKPIDTLSNEWDEVYPGIRKYFFECEWFEAYDFIEFVTNNYSDSSEVHAGLGATFNDVLAKESSAYRFVSGNIVQVTEEQEIVAIEKAMEDFRGPVQAHLRRALELISDRQNPDYRNSIKESISSVESLVALIVGERGTLGQLLKKLEDQQVHPALRTAFNTLYGYASDVGGIRHALLEAENVSFEEAKFFLVTCSAFVSYVQGKLPVSK